MLWCLAMKSFFCKKTFCDGGGDGCRWHLDMGTKKMQSKDIPQKYSTFPNCIFCKIKNKITSTICWLFGASREHICVGVNSKSRNEQMLQPLMIIHWAFPDNPDKVLRNNFVHILGIVLAKHDPNSYSYCTIGPLSVPRSLRSHQSA